MSSQAKAFILSCLISAVLADKPQEVRGVSLKKLDLYKPLPGNKFSCFNDSKKQYDFSVVNDDYCDCTDGSDEPGTSACPEMKFTCNNKGYKPARILSSRVNDGICDPECCDGSDEYDGKITCPDVCEKIAKESISNQLAYQEMVEKCLKIKSDYISQYATFKSTTQGKILLLKDQISKQKAKIEDLKLIKEVKEEEDKKREDNTENTKDNSQIAHIKMLEDKIEDIKEVVVDLQEDLKHLKSVLEELKLNHNQNYHDLAVKGAVTAYDEFATKYSEIDIDNDSRFAYEKMPDTPEVEASEGEAHKDQNASFGGDTFQKLYHEILKLRNRLFNYASGILPIGPKDVTHARNDFYDAENELRNLEEDLEKAEDKLNTDFGSHGEYVALNEKCYDFVNSEYTYTICMFGEVHQKSNRDSSSTLLGNFEKWEGSNYDMQLYSGGAHCWHGPNRLTKVSIECGAEEKVLAVSEPEKCEYHLRMTSPAACQPINQEPVVESNEEQYDEL